MIKTKTELFNESISWYGTPFGPGSLKGQSCSCTGLLAGIAKAAGLDRIYKEFERYQGHVRPENSSMLILKLRSLLELGDRKNIKPFDVLAFKTGYNWHHVALMLYDNYIIEANDILGKVTYHLLDREPTLVLKVQEIQSWPD